MDYLFVSSRDSWSDAHNRVIDNFDHGRAVQPNERALLSMAKGITEYVRWMGSPDGHLTPGIGQMLSGFLTLLDGDLGRLDGGTLSAWAHGIAEDAGWNLELETWK